MIEMTPLPSTLLKVLPGGEIPADQQPEQESPRAKAAADTPAPASLAVKLEGDTLALAEQTRDFLRHAMDQARGRFRDAKRREGGIVHAAYTGQPESLEDLDKYRASRQWVPVAHRGGDSFAERENALYLATIGRSGVAFGNWVSWTCARQFRFWLTVLFFLVLMAVIILTAVYGFGLG